MTAESEAEPARAMPGRWRTAALAALTLWLPPLLPREGARFVQVVLMAVIAGWSFFWAMVIDGIGC